MYLRPSPLGKTLVGPLETKHDWPEIAKKLDSCKNFKKVSVVGIIAV